MKNSYQFYCKTPEERTAILRALVGVGCQIHGTALSVEYFNKKFTYCDFPIITVTVKNKYVVGNRGGWGLPTQEGIEQLGEVITAILNPEPEPPKIVFPEPAKYEITYKTLGGETKIYLVSNPIEADNTKFTAYAFKAGVRSFIKSRVLTFKKVT
jgi:hypothetical protein